MRRRMALVLPALLAILTYSSKLLAQTNNRTATQATAAKASAPAPADSHDLSGVWNALRSHYDTASFSKGDPPMTAWGHAAVQCGEAVAGTPRGVLLAQTNDRVYQMLPAGHALYLFAAFSHGNRADARKK